MIKENEAYKDDILPLKDCFGIVKEWSFDYIERGKEEVKEAEERYLNKEDDKGNLINDYNMYGHRIKRAGEIFQQNFCFDCNVFNIEKYNYSVPEDIKNYYAVMVDIHN